MAAEAPAGLMVVVASPGMVCSVSSTFLVSGDAPVFNFGEAGSNWLRGWLGEVQRGEERRVVWRKTEGKCSFYSFTERAEGGRQVDGRGGAPGCEGARREEERALHIMAILWDRMT